MCSMETLKKIFSLKKNRQNEDDWKTDKEDQEQIRITYYQSGFAASQKAMGKSLVFKACLENVYNSFEDQCRKQLVKQKRLKQPYVEEKVRLGYDMIIGLDLLNDLGVIIDFEKKFSCGMVQT